MNNAEIAKCLAEVSALVAAGHPYEKCVQSRWTPEYAKKYGYSREWVINSTPDWKNTNYESRVAKGFVEGKPVFEDSVCFGRTGGIRHVMDINGRWDGWLAFEKLDATWTPPAPKVEIPEVFIEWHGGECPVDGGLVVTVLLRNGEYREKYLAKHFRWNHIPLDGVARADIIAYNVHIRA